MRGFDDESFQQPGDSLDQDQDNRIQIQSHPLRDDGNGHNESALLNTLPCDHDSHLKRSTSSEGIDHFTTIIGSSDDMMEFKPYQLNSWGSEDHISSMSGSSHHSPMKVQDVDDTALSMNMPLTLPDTSSSAQ
jgi:hypothetical protein